MESGKDVSRSDRPSDANCRNADVSTELDSAKQELLRQQRQETERLKAGGSSKLTNEFGKILIEGLNKIADTHELPTLERGALRQASEVLRRIMNAAMGTDERPIDRIMSEAGTVDALPGDTVGDGISEADAIDKQPVDVHGDITSVSKQFGGQIGHTGGDSQHTDERARSRGDAVVTPLAHPNFDGEVLNLEVPPATHIVQRGETVLDIARQNLRWTNASEADVRRHAREIEHANGRRHGERLTPNEILTLPGHTSDGGYVTLKEVKWQDGIAPTRWTASQGDTIESLARNHLGPGASTTEVARHAEEIRQANFPAGEPQNLAGLKILLPGHTTDGQLVTDPDHVPTVRRIVWADGVERIEEQNKDGNLTGVGYVRRPGEGDAYFEHHWGPRPEDNYDLTRNAGGRYLVSEPPGSTAVDRTDANDFRVNSARWDEGPQTNEVEKERMNLDSLIEHAHATTAADGTALLDDATQQKLQGDITQFEVRAREQGLSPQEVAKTYQEIARLLRDPIDKERVRLVGEILDQAAHPTRINQGQHGTCAVASLESRIYTRHPSDAAHLIADVVLTGHYTTKDGSNIEVRPDMLLQNEEKKHERGDDARSRASEIFQVTAVNIEYQRHGVRSEDGSRELIPAGQARYAQHSVVPKQNPPDHGDRIIDSRTNRPLTESTDKPIAFPGLYANQQIDISRQIIGIEEGDKALSSYARGSSGDRAEQITSEQNLREKLTELRRSGHLPVQICVHARNEPLWSDSGGGAAGGSGSWHVVTVTDFDERTGRVSVDNQWGPNSDHFREQAMDVGDLYVATLKPGSAEMINELKHRHQDLSTQLEMLRQQHIARGDNEQSHQEFARLLGHLMVKIDNGYRAGYIPNEELDRLFVRYADALMDLPAEARSDVVRLVDISLRTPLQNELNRRMEIRQATRRRAEGGD